MCPLGCGQLTKEEYGRLKGSDSAPIISLNFFLSFTNTFVCNENTKYLKARAQKKKRGIVPNFGNPCCVEAPRGLGQSPQVNQRPVLGAPAQSSKLGNCLGYSRLMILLRAISVNIDDMGPGFTSLVTCSSMLARTGAGSCSNRS
jgi:hypothetical protein